MQIAVLVPALHETSALRTTVDVLVAENAARLQAIIVLVADTTTEACAQVAAELVQRYPRWVTVVRQERPGLGGALQDGFARAQGSHVLTMAADLETPPHVVKELIATAEGGYDIVAATRWGSGGRFPRSLSPRQQAMQWTFEKLCQSLYATQLTDLTFGFRLYRREWVVGRSWPTEKVPFMLETLLVPLRQGAKVVEVPCAWRQRDETQLDQELWAKLACLPRAVKTRFVAKARAKP